MSPQSTDDQRNVPRPVAGSGGTRLLLDANEIDRLAEDGETLSRLVAHRDAGRIAILMVETQAIEIIEIPDAERQKRLVAVVVKLAPTYAPSTYVALPVESLGLGDASEFARDVAKLQGGRVRDTADIAMVTAAKWAGAILVSNDRRILRRVRREVPDVWTMTHEELAALLGTFEPRP